MASKFRFRRSFGNVNSRFRGAIPKHFPLFTGLLDDFGGAAFAASLRLLNNDFQNEGIVGVRRASDSDIQFVKVDKSFAQPLITLNSPLVGSSATFGDFVSGTDGFVTDWVDQATIGGNDATQATTTAQPKIVDAGSLIVDSNGFPYIKGDMSQLDCPVTVSGVGDDSIFITLPDLDVLSIQKILSNRTSSNGWQMVITSTNGLIKIDPNKGSGPTTTRTTGENTLISMIFDGAGGIDIDEDGSDSFMASGILTNSNTLSIFSNDAGSENFDGGMGELIIYPTDQSANRVAIETNINAAYNIF